MDIISYTGDSTAVDAAIGGSVIGVLLATYFVALIASYVVTSIFLGMIFKKAGVESWIAWVPFYNTWKILELGGQQGFWAILALVPLVGIVSLVFMVMAVYDIGLKFGKEGWFVVLAIFLPLVWLIWLAVDKTAVWNAPANNSASPAAPPVAPAV